MNLRYDSDMASDLKDEKDFNHDYDYTKFDRNYTSVEIIELYSDDEIYQKRKGKYISIAFDDLDNEACFEEVVKVLIEMIKVLLPQDEAIKKVLICGLGNSDLACDRLGPLLKNRIHIHEVGTTFLLIPGVKGQTGIESFDLISSYTKKIKPDLVILVDALATSSIQRLNHVIQLTDTGLRPGSGVGNHCQELTKDSLSTPVISLGVPTVVRLVNIAIDMMKYLNIEDDSFYKQIQDSHFHQIVMDKGCDLQVEQLSDLISKAINLFLNEIK